ncbi:MAG: hypothetical protein HYZ18_14745 [Pseudogulbenkiania sp.]|nr:hypothetical protein [Pseudogulbenkiania sp.]
MVGVQTWALRLVVAGAVLGGAWWHGWHTRGDVVERAASDKALADSRAALKDFASEADRLNGISAAVQAAVDQLASQSSTHIVEYRTHEKLVPLPADCRLDPERLRQLQSAVDDVNAAIFAGQSVEAGGTGRSAND